jgi:hypothetical protein
MPPALAIELTAADTGIQLQSPDSVAQSPGSVAAIPESVAATDVRLLPLHDPGLSGTTVPS